MILRISMILVPVAPHHFCQPCKYMEFFGTSMILVPAAPTTPLQEQCECYKFIRFPTILVPIAVSAAAGGGGGRRAAGGGCRRGNGRIAPPHGP